MFINNWRRNYTDIYQPTFKYSTEEEKEETEENLPHSKCQTCLVCVDFSLSLSVSLGAGGRQQDGQQDVQDVSSCESKFQIDKYIEKLHVELTMANMSDCQDVGYLHKCFFFLNPVSQLCTHQSVKSKG